jgi:hypothetical protein
MSTSIESVTDPTLNVFIEALTQLDAAASIGPAAGAGRQLQPAGTEADGVVVGDGARVAAAQDQREIAGGRRQAGMGSAGGRAKRRL